MDNSKEESSKTDNPDILELINSETFKEMKEKYPVFLIDIEE